MNDGSILTKIIKGAQEKKKKKVVLKTDGGDIEFNVPPKKK